ncbi:unnamed protein product [Ectocarpus sp. 12 AP-2014]
MFFFFCYLRLDRPRLLRTAEAAVLLLLFALLLLLLRLSQCFVLCVRCMCWGRPGFWRTLSSPDSSGPHPSSCVRAHPPSMVMADLYTILLINCFVSCGACVRSK